MEILKKVNRILKKLGTMTLVLLSLCVYAALLISCGSKQDGKPADMQAQSSSALRDSIRIELVGRDSVSVFSLLTESHKVETFSTALGVFVKAIDSVANGPHAFWIYSVNDSMPEIASDKLLTRNSDRVVWHFRKQE